MHCITPRLHLECWTTNAKKSCAVTWCCEFVAGTCWQRAAHNLTCIMQSSCIHTWQLRLLPGLHQKAAVFDVVVQLQALKIPLVAPSLGGVESLITRPATTTHVGMPQEKRQVCYHSPFTLHTVSNCSAALSLAELMLVCLVCTILQWFIVF